jgi:hypothetical protein
MRRLAGAKGCSRYRSGRLTSAKSAILRRRLMIEVMKKMAPRRT